MVHHVIGLPLATKGMAAGNARLSLHRGSVERPSLAGTRGGSATSFLVNRPSTELVGREEESAVLHAALYRYLRASSPERIVIDGAGGTGKTALLKHFVE